MRKRIWLLGITILAICILFVLLRTAKQDQTASRELTMAVTNQPNQSAQLEQVETAENRGIPRQITNPGAVPPRSSGGIERSNEIYQQMQANWQKPIEFYGKVMDENSNVVVGANIMFRWADRTEDVNTSTTQSDTEGLFSLHGKLGRSLHVWVSKESYYASHGGEASFLYSLGNDIYSPDPQNPVIFSLRKKGTPETLIKTDFPAGMGQIAQLRHEGNPIEIDLLKGEKVPEGDGHLKLEFWRDTSAKNAKVFDWKLQLTIPGGGLVETSQEFAFEAPQNGYQPAIVIDMPATNQNWRGEIRSKYYIQLPDGKYGRIDLYLLTFNGVFTVQSAVNPSGSRNLEPK